MSRFLILLGISFIILGLISPLIEKIGIGRLPGDIYIEGENFKFYFPITSCIIFSILTVFISWIINKYIL